MKYQFFTVPVIGSKNEQESLNRFCTQHRIVEIEKQLIMQGNQYIWAFCLSYMEGESDSLQEKNKSSPRKRIDYKEVLNESDFSLYVALRELRKQRAEQQGVPVYTIFTNEQLSTMVQKRIHSLAQLQAIEGIGEARTKKYGDEFITELSRLFNETPKH